MSTISAEYGRTGAVTDGAVADQPEANEASTHHAGAATGATQATSPRLAPMPGLDGMRGLAVAVVVVYHAGFEWLVGGFLGVSTFFTLSGFLITALLVAELRQHGSLDLRLFWRRRVRRLLPATLVTLLLVFLVFGFVAGTADQRAGLRGDVLGSLFNVANWRFVIGDADYGAFFSQPSPVLHFWSLAVEEQFYLVFPLLLLALWRVASGRFRYMGIALAALAVVSTALPVVTGMSINRAYFGTDTRAAELLLGALLALVLFSQRWQSGPGKSRRVQMLVAAMAGTVVAIQAYWWWSLPQSTPWLYQGGLAIYAAMTCVLIAAVTLPGGALAKAFSWAPLRWLGTRSFAIYLLHWPLLLVVRQVAPDLNRGIQAALAIAASLAIAEVSFRALEHPIRQGRWPAATHTFKVAALGIAVVGLLTLLPMRVDKANETLNFEAALAQFNGPQTTPNPGTPPVPDAEQTAIAGVGFAPPSATAIDPDQSGETVGAAPLVTEPQPASDPVPDAPDSATIAAFGDSTGMFMQLGLAQYAQLHPSPLRAVGGKVALGCGVSRFDRRMLETEETIWDHCRSWPETWSAEVSRLQPDIAMLVTGAWEVPDVIVPGGLTWSAIGDPSVDAFVKSEIAAATDVLSSQGAMVLLVLWPEFGAWADDGKPDAISRQIDPARMDRLHALMREVAAERPDTVRVLDLPAILGDHVIQDPAIRPDGLHISDAKMAELYAAGVAQQMKDMWAAWWQQKQS